MNRPVFFCMMLSLLSACSGDGTNPFTQAANTNADGTTTQTSNTGDPITSDRTILPGTVNPSADDSIFRREAQDAEKGNGYAENIRYEGATDTFYVDNLAFDGEGGYTSVKTGGGANLGIGPFRVFENQAKAIDGLTSNDVNQLQYRALYGISPDGQSSIAIVRTGAYINYGFGGYIYQRNGGVTLPSSGQAIYSGTDNYGGLRDFIGRSGLEYVNGDIEVRIDFNDFNEGAGVIGVVRNRRVFDINQTDITGDLLTAFGGGTTQLPTLYFKIQPGVLDSNGELSGSIESTNPSDGKTFETGNYYAILSGDQAQTITGVIVVTGEDPRNKDHTFRETAGFFATR